MGAPSQGNQGRPKAPGQEDTWERTKPSVHTHSSFPRKLGNQQRPRELSLYQCVRTQLEGIVVSKTPERRKIRVLTWEQRVTMRNTVGLGHTY